jgi:sugar lactone lactonase YvrE
VVLAVPLGIGSAVAHDDRDHDGDDLDVDVVAEGLDSPRGLALDRRDNLWIAQAGRGGDGPCFPGPEGPTCLGATGKISVLTEHDDDDDRDRDRRRGHDRLTVVDVVTGLPSLGLEGTGRNAIGPSDVAFDRRGRLFATIGLGGDPDLRTTPEPGGVGPSALASQLATVVRVDARAGTVSEFADIGDFELAVNPEPSDEDTNPNSIAIHRNQRLVADAGGNALLRLDGDGGVESVFTFPQEAPVQIPGAPPGAMIEADPVPNTVVRGPDGAFYVGQLTGFPFTPGTATVWRFKNAHDTRPTVYADGFTNIIDLAFDDDGNLLVLEIAHHGLLAAFGAEDWSGALIRVDEDDPSEHTILLEAPLFAPGGIVVDDDDAYISNRSVFPGEGEILKVELDD